MCEGRRCHQWVLLGHSVDYCVRCGCVRRYTKWRPELFYPSGRKTKKDFAAWRDRNRPGHGR